MTLIHCQFCGALHQPNEWRKPSQCCAKCWLEIQAQLVEPVPEVKVIQWTIQLARPEPDFTAENNRRITYTPESWVLM